MKKIVCMCLIMMVFALNIKVVNAKRIASFANGTMKSNSCEVSKYDTCQSLFGSPDCEEHVAYYLQLGLDIIKYLGITLCILLTIVDFAKALFSDEKDMFKPLSKKALNRLIYAVLLFFLPIIVKAILSLVGIYSTCSIQ